MPRLRQDNALGRVETRPLRPTWIPSILMIWKLLLTAAVLLGAYGVIRARIRAQRVAQGLEPPRQPLFPPGTIRLTAALLVAVMVIGSAFYLLQDWLHDQETIQVQVINANSGAITHYQARRGSVDGRRFQTLDGREIRLADVERMIILPTGAGE